MKILITWFVGVVVLIAGTAIAAPHGDFGPVTGGAMPPGLESRGLPPGLESHGKIPAGWSHGNKTGWRTTHGHHGHRHHTLMAVPSVTRVTR